MVSRGCTGCEPRRPQVRSQAGRAPRAEEEVGAAQGGAAGERAAGHQQVQQVDNLGGAAGDRRRRHEHDAGGPLAEGVERVLDRRAVVVRLQNVVHVVNFVAHQEAAPHGLEQVRVDLDVAAPHGLGEALAEGGARAERVLPI